MLHPEIRQLNTEALTIGTFHEKQKAHIANGISRVNHCFRGGKQMDTVSK